MSQSERARATHFLPSGNLFIAGEPRPSATGTVMEHIDPSTGRASKAFSLAGPADVDAAAKAARGAFPAWRALGASARRDLLLRLASLFEQHADMLAKVAVLENGTPMAFAGFVASVTPAEWFRYYAGWIDKLEGTVPPMLGGAGFNYSVRAPYGVVAIVTAFNAPMAFIGMKVAAALAASNCVIIKPSELAPWTALLFAEMCAEAGFPAGVVNVLPGGADAGRALATHAEIDKISFTGGGGTASAILASVAPLLKPATLELGGKSANIVFEDANIPLAIGCALGASVALQSGQACIAGTRLLVQRSIYRTVVEQIEAAAATLKVGDPMAIDTAMGPIISDFHCRRILDSVERFAASGDGKAVVRGGRLGGDLADGFFLAPTVFCDVDPASSLAQDEIFGPVLAIIPFDDEAQAVSIANDTRYGLAGYIFTENLGRALRVADRLEAGTISVNGPNFLPVNLPFGGVKASGFGREGGLEGIHDYTYSKGVQIALQS